MYRVIFYGAYVTNIILFCFLIFLAKSARGEEFFLALLVMLVPILSLIALYGGQGWEERKLAKNLNKLRMQKEIKDLEEELGTSAK